MSLISEPCTRAHLADCPAAPPTATDHETLDEWYGTQIQHATTFPFRAATVGTSLTGAAAGSLSPASPTEAGLAMLAGSAANSPRHARHTYQAGSVVAALGFEGASSSSSGRREALGISEPGGGAGVMHHTQPPLSPASYHHGRSPSSASSVISAATAPPALAAARSNMAGMSPTGKSGAVNVSVRGWARWPAFTQIAMCSPEAGQIAWY
jgi:hypothetical protein